MIGGWRMPRVTRRFFLLSSAALSVGCRTRVFDGAAANTANVRAPAIGQSWRYAQHDLFTRALVDIQVDRVTAIDRTVEIASNSEAAKEENANAKWGTEFLRKYLGHRGKPGGPLPSEIQGPWGMVLADPHWGLLQVYETPVPLWPEQLRAGWQTHVNTQYKTPASQSAMSWQQTMKAHAWETLSVPAGQFNALRFTNTIHFVSGDLSRRDSVRQETLWFAPEVGRWVARESSGNYYEDDSVVDQPYNENGFRWELLEWS
jgi:hypothetical protein